MVKLLLPLLLSAVLHGAWDPKALNEGQERYPLETLKHWTFRAVEGQVLAAVRNTWCSEEKARLLLESVTLIRPEVCVEIGPFAGSATLPLLAALKYTKKGHCYAIDAWSNEEAVKGLSDQDHNTQWWAHVDMAHAKRQFLSLLEAWSFAPFCTVIHAPSSLAVSSVPPIDFLHLDGNFSEAGALEDTLLYASKVKKGGYVLFSNVFMMIEGDMTKKRALWILFDQCEIVSEIENGNVILFKKL